MYTGEDVGIVYIYIYLDNPPMQNYRSKSETAIIVASCLKYRCFQFFGAVWMFFFRRFNTGKHVQRQKNTKLAHKQKNMSPAIVPEMDV